MAKDPGTADSSELVQQANEIREQWIHGGTPEPPAPPAPPAPDPPPVPAVPPTSGPTTPAEPPAPAPAAAAPPASPATAAEVQEFIEAIIREAEGEKPAETLKIPLTAKLPLKVQGAVQYVPLQDFRDGGQRLEDYKAKTREVAEARRELEQHAAQLIADRARLEARDKWMQDERTRLREAQKSPEAWERYQNHLRLMQEDPEYAKTFEDALDGRERKAEATATAAADERRLVQDGVAQAADWILTIGQEPAFQRVDLDRVRERYAAALERGQAALDPAAVRAIFDSEAHYLQASLGPVEQELADLRAQVAALSGATSAAAHNRATQHAIDRAKAPPVVTGQPAAPSVPDRKVKPFTPRELPDVNREWSNRRD